MQTRVFRNGNGNGFTAIEAVIVLTIIGVLSLIVYYSLGNFRNQQTVKIGAVGVAAFLSETRNLTLASRDDNQYGAHLESGRVTRFVGSVYSPSDPKNEVYNLDVKLTLSPINLSGGATDIVWSRLSGEASAFGDITVALSSNPSILRKVQVSKTGLVTTE